MWFKKAIPLLIFLIVLIGCKENNLNIKDNVTSIEVYQCCNNDDTIAEITDQAFIDDLMTKLKKTDTGRTADVKFLPPEYRLDFKADDEIVYKMGYFTEVGNIALDGRYWDFTNERMYGIDKELPLE